MNTKHQTRNNYLSLSLFIIAVISCTLQSCKKDVVTSEWGIKPVPAIRTTYLELPNSVFIYGSSSPIIDVDKDGIVDFYFKAEQVQDEAYLKTSFYIAPSDNNEILGFGNAETLPKDVLINATTFVLGVKWSNMEGLLFYKMEMEDKEIYSQGFWTPISSAYNRYLGIRMKKDGKYYYGWIQMKLVLDSAFNYKMVLVCAAINTEAETGIATGN